MNQRIISYPRQSGHSQRLLERAVQRHQTIQNVVKSSPRGNTAIKMLVRKNLHKSKGAKTIMNKYYSAVTVQNPNKLYPTQFFTVETDIPLSPNHTFTIQSATYYVDRIEDNEAIVTLVEQNHLVNVTREDFLKETSSRKENKAKTVHRAERKMNEITYYQYEVSISISETKAMQYVQIISKREIEVGELIIIDNEVFEVDRIYAEEHTLPTVYVIPIKQKSLITHVTHTFNKFEVR